MTTMQKTQQSGVRSRTPGWAPWIGLAGVVLAIVSIILPGSPPDASSPTSEIVDHYADNETMIQISSLLAVAAVVLVVFFGAYLRSVLSRAEPGGDMLATVALVGTAVIGVGVAIDSTISFALVEAAPDVDPVAMQAMQALWDSDFVPMLLGAQLMLLAAGLSIVRHAALPKWLGWVALGLAVVGFTPIGFAAFVGLGLWVAVVSILLGVRGEPMRG